jgi:hypothetical protein
MYYSSDWEVQREKMVAWRRLCVGNREEMEEGSRGFIAADSLRPLGHGRERGSWVVGAGVCEENGREVGDDPGRWGQSVREREREKVRGDFLGWLLGSYPGLAQVLLCFYLFFFLFSFPIFCLVSCLV